MTEHRVPPNFTPGRYLLLNGSYVLIGSAGLLLAFFGPRPGGLPTFIIGLSIFFAAMIFGISLDFVRYRRFRCPECRRRLPYTRPEDRYEEITFTCPDCDIVWNTRTSYGDGGG